MDGYDNDGILLLLDDDLFWREEDVEFAKLINGREQREVFRVMDELMETLRAINPRLYASVIRKLQ